MSVSYKITRDVRKCVIVERVNRFTVRVLIDGETKAHITNTGRLKDLLVSGRAGYCHEIDGVKLKYRLFAVEERGLGALIDTLLQQKVFEYLLASSKIPWLQNCRVKAVNPRLRGEVIDYLISCSDTNYYVELKSAVLRIGSGYAGYPDCPTLRGRKQIRALIDHVVSGGKAILVFIAGLPHTKAFKPYDEGDPVAAQLIREAQRRGVIIKSIGMHYNPLTKEIVVYNTDLPVNVD